MEIKKIADNNQIELFVGIKLDDHLTNDYSNYDYLYIFVNPSSGSQEGKIILNIGQKYAHEKDDRKIVLLFEKLKVILFDIKNRESFKLAKELIKEHTEKIRKNVNDTKIRIIIGGGDGTVLSIIEELFNSKIDLSKCLFGHLPLGTGNDLSNSLGFGSNYY